MILWTLLIALPLGGLALLLANRDADVHWEHHPAHFWLVLGVSIVSVTLGALTSEAATRRGDARLFLVSIAFLESAGFLGLHALATPGVLLEGKNAGFTVATPVGLLLAAWSAGGVGARSTGGLPGVSANDPLGHGGDDRGLGCPFVV